MQSLRSAVLVAMTVATSACYVGDDVMPVASSPRALRATSLGCFKDQGDSGGPNHRDLDGMMMTMPGMTTEICTATCDFRGFAFAATQDGSQCFCGMAYGRSGTSDACNMRCGGNPNETCGGVWANSVYQVR